MKPRRRPPLDRPDALPVSIVDLSPWGDGPDAHPAGASTTLHADDHRRGSPTAIDVAIDVDAHREDAAVSTSPSRSRSDRDARGSNRSRRGWGRTRLGADNRTADGAQTIGATEPDRGASAALARGFGALASRAHTRREMDTRLDRAGFSPEAVDHAVGRLVDLGYIDDAAYAEAWVSSRRAHQRHGTLRLRHDLARRGVDAETVAAATTDDGDEDVRAAAVAARIAPSLTRVDRATATRRLAGALARRGFTAPVVNRTVRATLDGLAIDNSGDHIPDDTDDTDEPA